MHLIIDGYNLLHVNRSMTSLTPLELQQERDRLIDELSVYRHRKPADITVVFDGWQGGWVTEQTEKRRGIEIVFSRLGEKADEVIKRRIREQGRRLGSYQLGPGAFEIRRAVVGLGDFLSAIQGKDGGRSLSSWRGKDDDEGEEGIGKRKGPSRTLSKREKRARAALKKL